MCDIPEGLKARGADSRDGAPAGGGAGKQMVGGRCRRVWAEQRWREVNICLACETKTNPVVRSNLGLEAHGERRSLPSNVSCPQPPLARPSPAPRSSDPAARSPRRSEARGEVGSAPAVGPARGRGRGGGAAWRRSARAVLRCFQIVPRTPGVLGGPGPAAGEKRGLASVDCGLPPPSASARGTVGAGLPRAPRGVTGLACAAARRSSPHPEFGFQPLGLLPSEIIVGLGRSVLPSHREPGRLRPPGTGRFGDGGGAGAASHV